MQVAEIGLSRVRILAYTGCQSASSMSGGGTAGGGGERTNLQAELADGLAVLARLLRGSGRGQLDVVDAKGIEGYTG